jgi:hypothetical protein
MQASGSIERRSAPVSRCWAPVHWADAADVDGASSLDGRERSKAASVNAHETGKFSELTGERGGSGTPGQAMRRPARTSSRRAVAWHEAGGWVQELFWRGCCSLDSLMACGGRLDVTLARLANESGRAGAAEL